jgi:hypothetical protein
MPQQGEPTHPSFKVQLATPGKSASRLKLGGKNIIVRASRRGIRKDAEERLEGAILNYLDL